MNLIIESSNINDYLIEILPIIQFKSNRIQQEISKINQSNQTDYEKAKQAFMISRDEIRHSFDTKNPIVTINSDDVLKSHEGICFAKSHLFAALLRGMNIPCGFCYQRVLKNGKSKDGGYALHGLNALFLKDFGWFRVDPRGNKPGVNSQFSINPEMLAYPIREELGEIDYPTVFAKPLDSVIQSMCNSSTSQELFDNRPEMI